MSRRCELTGVGPLRDVRVGRPDNAIIWLLLTLLIDGVDGPIAHALEVEKRVPGLDGFLLTAKDEALPPRALKIKRQVKAKLASMAQPAG